MSPSRQLKPSLNKVSILKISAKDRDADLILLVIPNISQQLSSTLDHRGNKLTDLSGSGFRFLIIHVCVRASVCVRPYVKKVQETENSLD